MPPQVKIPDQDDAIAMLADAQQRLELSQKTLGEITSKLSTAEKERDEARGEVGTLKTSLKTAEDALSGNKNTIEALTKERDEARKEAADLKASAKTVEEHVAVKLAQLGIKQKVSTASDEKGATLSDDKLKGLTLTQQALLANGRDPNEKVSLFK